MADPVVATPGVFLDFSPVRRDEDTDKENDVPVLTLIQFSKAPFVSFGSVKVGTSKSVLLHIQNPTDDSEAAVTVEKIPAGRGFSADCSSFTIPPEGSFTLRLSWTPVEEGGVRELVVFNANGILKHQAVLLGRAEAPKKKKKSLWDAIKNKRHREKVAAPMKTKADPSLKMAPNKTFQVGRNPQYKRHKARSPLAAISKGNAGREPSRVKASSSHNLKAEERNKREENQDQVPPRVLLVPAAQLLDTINTSTSSDKTVLKPEGKNLLPALNRTLSPIGTPDRLRRMMPRIQTDAVPPFTYTAELNDDGDGMERESPGLSLKDALVVIGSDLSHASSSPADAGSSSNFSDSLEIKSGERGGVHASPNGPEPAAESLEPRLTFFVSKKPGLGEASELVAKVRKPCFTSATVTKVRAVTALESPGGRKVKTSRRRLLEKTLDGHSDGGTGTPTLPIIDSDTGTPSALLMASPVSCPTAFPLSSLPSTPPPPFSFSVLSPPPLALHTSSPLPISSSPLLSRPAVDAQDSFPVQLAAKSKKRKSEEFLKGNGKPEGEEGSEKVKRSRGVVAKVEVRRQERRRSLSQRKKPAGLVCSVPSSSSVHTQAKQPGSKLSVRGSVKKSTVVAVAQSKLTFIRPSQTALPRHPTPFAATNMFYDERWMEKQERGFTWWLNYVLTPDDFKVNTHVSKASAVSLAIGSEDTLSIPKAPTKEEMSFSTYTARRKLNSLRRAACRLFTSDAMVTAIRRLELEVEARRLLVRRDRHLWKDIGERRKVLDWLLSYNPLWLRIGLETIFGELISLQSNSDTLGLALFMLQRLLWNPDIAAQFRHPRVPNLYRDGHEEALSRFTLKKLLLLVCFLDKAKESRLIQHDPCLFCQDAEFKNSKDLLLAFSRDFLSGEGNLHRHLGYIGLPVSHVQKPLDEFDFAVQNLAVDLKCGIRLVRVTELLLQKWGLSAKLRLPAVSRLQKVHNVDVALQELRSRGVDLQEEHGSVIQSRDIVDGHREKTLSLLWKIIFTFHVEVILDQDQLREEICFLKESLRTKRRLASLRADQGPLSSPSKSRDPYKHGSTSLVLLMDWVRAVCDFYNLKVENFSVSFSDGRVLCYLIHHYHPGLLPAAALHHATTQTVESSAGGRLELDCSASDSDGSFHASLELNDSPSPSFKELLNNEKTNFRLVNSAVASLGGVPAMINPADMSNTIPNEKVVMSFLSFLCARLLDLRNETRAARLIQAAWRKYRLKQDLQLYQERSVAAGKIQAMVRKFLQNRRAKRRNEAAVIIQSFWRGHKSRNRLRLEREAQRREEMHQAATLIQARWRMFSALTSFRRLRYFTIVVQAEWRMVMAASAYRKLHEAVTVVQERWQARVLSRTQREAFLRLRRAAVVVQRLYRKRRACKTQKENSAARVIQTAFRKWRQVKMVRKTTAAVKIQSLVRMWACLHQYRRIRLAAVVIQARYRGCTQRRCFQAMKQQHVAAITLQSVFRGFAVRRQAARRQRAAVVIQHRFRASVLRDKGREEFFRLRRAAITIQAAYRGKVARESLNKQQEAATVIQAAFRRSAAQRRYISLRRVTAAMQRRYRATALACQTRKEFLSLRNAAVMLQATWRGRADRATLRTWHRCAMLIQAQYRRHRAQTEYRSIRAAAVNIQCHYRASVACQEARKAFLQKKAACITLQAGFRGLRVRAELNKKKQAATLIQSLVRMYFYRKHFVLLQSAAIVMQSRFRALRLCRVQQDKFRRLKRNAIKIQAAFRGFRARKELKERNKAATLLQAHFRMYKMRSSYLATKCAAIIIQERYRAKVQRDRQLQRFSAMKAAAAVIQSAYRCHHARRMQEVRNRAATVIQRKFLSFRQRKHFLVVKAAALFCQQRFRGVTMVRNQRRDFLSQRRAAVCLQAAFRGYQMRKRLRTENAAAATIQSAFKGFQQKSKYMRLRWAAVVLQARYRANKQMRAAVGALRVQRHAAIVLQSAYRGMKTRQILTQRHQAACVIQRAFRVQYQRSSFLTLKSSVIVVQRRYRAILAARRQRRDYEEMRQAAIVLQSVFRGQQVRKQLAGCHIAATIIQAAFRKHREEVKFQALRLAAIILQRRYRAQRLKSAEVKHYREVRGAVVTLQASYRGMRSRRIIKHQHHAASVIQRAFRAQRERNDYLKLRSTVRSLQRRYRANVAAKEQMQRYQNLRRAVVILQSACRGQQVRKRLARHHLAATVIQAAFRKHREEVKFQALRLAAIILQRRYRAQQLQRGEREKFLLMRRSAGVLQAAFRGCRVRSKISKMHRAASVIQANFRRHEQQAVYRKQRWAAVVLQQRFRAQKQRNLEVERYKEVREAAVAIQAAYRGMRSRRLVKHQHHAASVIQRAFRAQRERHEYLKLRSTVRSLQRRYRANVAAKEQMQRYQNLRRAVVILQSACRGQQVRKRLARHHLAATVIQAAFRKHREEVKFQALRLAAIILQRRYRAQQLQRGEREKFLLMRRSAGVLQAAFRGCRVRSKISKMHRAASVIQANFRRHEQQAVYRKQRWAAVVLQQRFRAQKQRNLEVERYKEVREAAVAIQAAYRGMRSRRLVKHQHHAASVIQRAFRAQRERHEYLKLRSTVRSLQRRYRANVAAKEQMQRYQNLRRAVVILQSACRGQQVRKRLARHHLAATVIQAAFRKHREEVKFQALRLAAIILQRRYRAQRFGNLEVERYQEVRRAAIILQAAYRGMRSRQLVKQQHQAASLLQRAFRTQRERRQYLKVKFFIITIQRKYRATAAAIAQREKYLELRQAAIFVQSACRGQQVRKQLARRHLAATVIQAAFRKHREEVKFQALRLAAIILQRRYRAQQLQRGEREKFLLMRRSAVVLQAAFRGCRVRSKISKMHRAASVIQANFRRREQQAVYRKQRWAAVVLQQRFRAQKRRNLEVERYQEVRQAAVAIQAAYRGMRSRKVLKHQHHAASVIQRAFRAQRERHGYLKLRSTVRSLQRRYRANVAAKEQMQRYQNLRRAVVVLQSACRGQQVRNQLARRHLAATVIQAAFRKHREEVKFQALRLAAIILQRRFRAQRLQRGEKEKFLQLRHSAIVLQAAFRGWRVRRDLRHRDDAAVVIQAWWRSWVQRRVYRRTREATMRLQRRVRAQRLGREERRSYARKRNAAITLQRSCRSWTNRRRALEAAREVRRLRFTSAVFHHLSAIKIQRSLRAHWALEAARTQIQSVVTIQRWVRAKQQRSHYLAFRVKVVTVQKVVRSWLARRHQAATVIQHSVRSFLLLRRQRKAERGIAKVQALWRGHRSRRLHDSPRLVGLRLRLREISAAIRDEDKLCNKTSAALDYLLRYKHFSEILEALKNLEAATRLSPECCERLLQSQAIHIIFTLIRSCNRSVPCMDVITFSIQILLNLSKYHKTMAAVYAAESSVETLLELLQRYREKAGDKVAEKGGNIFTKACFLLALLLQDHTHTEEVKQLPRVVERIRSIYRLTARKHKMDAERSITREKMNASINGRFLVPSTPRKSRPIPKFAPDWVLKKNKLKDVVDPLRAIQMVAGALDVVL